MEVAIVAIPAEDDYVWKISSEKIPHMTLLFLGDMEIGPATARIETFVSHVVDISMTRFGGEVDRRGTLGPDDADVLFFRKHDLKMVNAARLDMLAQDDIREAYNSTQQYPEWTPHLTLGYPASPAKVDTRDYPGINWINFDRIAIWFDDFDGPEFQLKSFAEEGGELAMAEYGGVVLEHHGVKGMKWGVRKDGSTSSTTITTSRLRKPATDVVAKQKPGQFVRTAGGTRQTAAEDAIRVAASRQLAKKSTTDALSNKQLQEAVNRMNLEQQYSQLVKKSDRRTRGQRFVQRLMGIQHPSEQVGKNNQNNGQQSASKVGNAVVDQLLKKSAP